MWCLLNVYVALNRDYSQKGDTCRTKATDTMTFCPYFFDVTCKEREYGN